MRCVTIEAMRNYKIGIFDSGLGGLTIAKGIFEQLPHYDYIYLGDNARVPYGSRSQRVVYRFVKNAVEELFRRDCFLIIIACNTASAEALAKIQQEYLPEHHPERRVLGVIRPAVEAAITGNVRRIGVLATESTVASTAFIQEIHKLHPDIEVIQNDAPLLVPIVEAGELGWEGTRLILEKYLAPFNEKLVDALILGCTHYGLLKDQIRQLLRPEIRLIVENEIMPAKLMDYLMRHPEIEEKLSKNRTRLFLVTDKSPRYEELTSLFLGRRIELELVEL